MKRDMELVRKILFAIEEHEHGFAPTDLEIEGFTPEQIGYHVHIMADGGLLKAADITHLGSRSPEASAGMLTWAGHEFLDLARSDTVWARTKKAAVDHGVGLSLEAAKALMSRFTLEMLGLS